MLSWRRSVATRLAAGYGLLVAASIAVLAIVFYSATLAEFDRNINGKISEISGRLTATYAERPREELAHEIEHLLSDGIDSDSEIYLLLSPGGRRLAGNISGALPASAMSHRLLDVRVVREGRSTLGRLLTTQLPDGAVLAVGRDLQDREAIRDIVWRALAIGAALSVVFIISGAVFFRRQIERRIGDIRHTAREIEAGNISRRIPVPPEQHGVDEFDRLKLDINRMLDRIQHLIEGVRHVSNAIAHDLRTPLGRVRNQLERALRSAPTTSSLTISTSAAIQEIDEVISMFEKLLQIAEAESGMRPESSELVDLGKIASDMVELSNAAEDEPRIQLANAGASEEVLTSGDRNLIAGAVSGLINNAVKYAGPQCVIEVGAMTERDCVSIFVRDNGPGIPDRELTRVTDRFYRLDSSRHMPGNGLGLSIASAIATLHRGQLKLMNLSPGLIAKLELPRYEPSAKAAPASA
jgi:signal transduction histidine kinase